MRISDWSSDVCSSDLSADGLLEEHQPIDEVRHELLLVRGPLFSISVQAGPAVPGCRFRSMRCRTDIPDDLFAAAVSQRPILHVCADCAPGRLDINQGKSCPPAFRSSEAPEETLGNVARGLTCGPR